MQQAQVMAYRQRPSSFEVSRRRKRGEKSRQIGIDGERLFLNLARQWGGFEYTPGAEGTDGYFSWPEVLADRLFVQIKSVEKQPRLKRGTSRFRVRVEPNYLRQWYAYRPLFIFCVLERNRAWWKDTAHETWQLDPTKPQYIEVPFNQSVDASTKVAIQKIALQRPRHLAPGILSSSDTRRVLKRHELVPPALLRLSSQDTLALLRDIYAKMDSTSIVERDGMALAAARLIHCNLQSLGTKSVDSFLEIVLPRLLSKAQGGRSNTLGALASLLRAGLDYQVDATFLDDLQRAIDRAVTAKTFVNPEFGLIIGASLVARFPRISHLSDHVRELSLQAISDPQTNAIRRVSHLLKASFEQRKGRIERIVSEKWLAMQIVRPLRQDDDIFRKVEQAREAAWRIVRCTPAEARPQDLSLFSQWTRVQAIDLLQRL